MVIAITGLMGFGYAVLHVLDNWLISGGPDDSMRMARFSSRTWWCSGLSRRPHSGQGLQRNIPWES
jgi:hypothetical protein